MLVTSDEDIDDTSKSIIYNHFHSPIFKGTILGCIVSIAMLILAIFIGMKGHIKGFDVLWDLRVGFFLTIVTIITRITSYVIEFMIPTIFAGILVLIQVTNLNESGTNINQLMEASIAHGIWSITKACFNSGRTRKLAIIIALPLLWQYVITMADLFIHATSIGNLQRLQGSTIQSPRSLEIATNCSDISYSDNCISHVQDPRKVLEVYQNVSESFQIRSNEDVIYLLQSPPPQQSYSFSGSGIFLQPSCKPISSICNVKVFNGGITNYTCPQTLWSVSGNTVTNAFFVNITSAINNLERYEASNPIHAIVNMHFDVDKSAHYDSEFVVELHNYLTILLHCQILASKIDYVVTLGSLKVISQENLTNSQLFTLGAASMQYIMVYRAIDDVEIVAHKGNSTLLANEFAQKWAQATISTFSVVVQENGVGKGYNYILEENIDQTIIPFSRLLYHALIEKHDREDRSLDSLAAQARRLEMIECSIKTDQGHLEFHKISKEML
ncbi:22026_t:CDS:2 [Dentiscutata erythropus]|uniref:22026_t:CDS:1 n=1 Tax=Dentiscutata erythropus TaxID=1348616 RepID=A0A9N9E5N9_9GLOM|nr:22026_t:CDS:2 [Dentiscutata erythropus]